MRMANARKSVKNQSNVGRAGKAGKEAQLVSVVYAMISNDFLVSLRHYVELGLVTLKCGPLIERVFMITEEEETEESRDYRNSGGTAGIRADWGMHLCKIQKVFACAFYWLLFSCMYGVILVSFCSCILHNMCHCVVVSSSQY